jgi:hypothetical protein
LRQCFGPIAGFFLYIYLESAREPNKNHGTRQKNQFDAMNDTEFALLLVLSVAFGYALMHFIMQYGKKWQEKRDAKNKDE